MEEAEDLPTPCLGLMVEIVFVCLWFPSHVKSGMPVMKQSRNFPSGQVCFPCTHDLDQYILPTFSSNY